jgi:nitrate reductase cytochrome c-type subunit
VVRVSNEENNKGIDLVRTRRAAVSAYLVMAVILLIVCVAGALIFSSVYRAGRPSLAQIEAMQHRSDQFASESSRTKQRFAVSIRKPEGPPRVDTGLTDAHGNAVTASCSTCHTIRKPNFKNKGVADLNEFHGALTFSHGSVSCLSCHNPEDYDSLKLADGTRVEFTDVMTLCAQCHGPQMKDYEHGVHGGMNGYWDLTRGPRTKNNCIDCHNPHAPQFPDMQPTFKPRDRFLKQEQAH